MRLRFFLLGAPLFLGCANKSLDRFDRIGNRAASQDFMAAIAEVRKEHSLYSNSDLLYYMDLGALYHYAGLYDSSIACLETAVKIKDDLFAHSVTNEAASLLVNDNVRPYRGHDYEITWMHMLLAFDYLAVNRYDDARVEVQQAQLFLKEARRKAGSDAKAYRDDGLFRTMASIIYEALGENDDALISLYQAVKSYEEIKEPVPSSLARYASAALSANGRGDDAKELNLPPVPPDAPGSSLDASEIVVVGEMGRSPALGETAFWGTWVRDGVMVYSYQDANGNTVTGALPAPGLPQSEYQKHGNTRSGTTLHVKWAMPSLKEVPSQSDVLRVSEDGSNYSGESLGNTRDLLQRDLDANRVSTLTRTVIRVVIRTLAEQEAKSKLNTGNPLANLLINVGADALSDQLEKADERVWFLLPRTVQILRVPVKPGHYNLNLGAASSGGTILRSETREVDVRAGEKKFVFFTSLK